MLNKFEIVYEVTAGDLILFAAKTSIVEPFKFTELEIPKQIKALPIECRFIIFNPEGGLVEMSMEKVFSGYLVATLNRVPLKMIKKVIPDIKLYSASKE